MTRYIKTDEQFHNLCEEYNVSSWSELASALQKENIFIIDDRVDTEYYEIEAQSSEENFDQFCHYDLTTNGY